MENIKKIKQSMKKYTEKLILVEKEVDNIDSSITLVREIRESFLKCV
jgi:predicted DNA-binding protein YlxM (UPF0122 family)